MQTLAMHRRSEVRPAFKTGMERSLMERLERPAHAQQRPAIQTSAYTFDRVQRIEVVQEVPLHLAAVGSLDGWRALARAEAFERLMQEIGSEADFTVECHLDESEEVSSEGRRRYLVTCELRYVLNR